MRLPGPALLLEALLDRVKGAPAASMAPLSRLIGHPESRSLDTEGSERTLAAAETKNPAIRGIAGNGLQKPEAFVKGTLLEDSIYLLKMGGNG